MRRRLAVAALAASTLVTAACSSSDTTTSSSVPATTSGSSIPGGECAPVEPTLRVDQIADAVAAVEQQLGGPQRYFEINATPLLVNLFVASADGTSVTPYLYAAGKLSSEAAQTANGATFPSAAVQIDPTLVTACVTAQLPTSQQDVFVIVGGTGDAVRYSILTTSSQGGQLIVEVTGRGAIVGVTPADAPPTTTE